MFRLYIYKHGKSFKEIFETKSGHRRELPLFGITNELIQAMPEKPASDRDIETKPEKSLLYLNNTREIHNVLTKFTENMDATKGLNLECENLSCEEGVRKLASMVLKSEVNYSNGHFETPVQFKAVFGKSLPEEEAYWLELRCIYKAVLDWLFPTGKGRRGTKTRLTPSQKFAQTWEIAHPLDLDIMLNPMEEAINRQAKTREQLFNGHLFIQLHKAMVQRKRQFITDFVAVTDGKSVTAKSHKFDKDEDYPGSPKYKYKYTQKERFTAELFTSEKGLLPLVWAEILYAVKNDIYAKFCRYCGSLFAGRPNKKCCRQKCTSEYEKEKQAKRRRERNNK